MKINFSLYDIFPELEKKLPRAGLAVLPTPLEPMALLGQELGIKKLYVKRDDLSGDIYGGNKIRKLDLIMPQALSAGARQVLTFGCDGSNHATATAVCAKLCNISSINLLFAQPHTDYVTKNLLLSKWAGARLCHVEKPEQLNRMALWQRLKGFLAKGKLPFIIPAGGSTPTGSMGFVNAAFELKAQIDEGLMPPPDYIFVPMGTTGTCSGLSVGLKACGLTQTTVVPVRIVNKEYVSENALWEHITATAKLFEELTGTDTDCTPEKAKVCVEDNYLGKSYGVYTPEGKNAMQLIQKTQGINLEGTYSGKTLAALIGRKNELTDKTVLFWNTYNSKDFSEKIKNMGPEDLPTNLRYYFTPTPAGNK